MSKNIDKIDKQIRMLSGKKNNTVGTEKVSKKELVRKANLKDLDEKIEKNKNSNITKNTQKSNESINKGTEIKQSLEEKLISLYEDNDVYVKSGSKTSDRALKNSTDSVIDGKNEKDNLSRVVIILFFIFMILVVFYIIFFIALSFA